MKNTTRLHLFRPWLSALVLFLAFSPTGNAEELFVRGDANSDGVVDIADVIRSLGNQFRDEGDIFCKDAADANDDGNFDVADPITILRYLFRGGMTSPAPGPNACGYDLTDDTLHCVTVGPCARVTTDIYRVFHNGTICFVPSEPCPFLTVSNESEEIEVVDLDLSPLGLSAKTTSVVTAELYAGQWLVTGYIRSHPQNSGGTWPVLLVLALVKRAVLPDPG